MLRIAFLLLGLGLLVNLAVLDYQMFFAPKVDTNINNLADLKLEISDLKSELTDLKAANPQPATPSVQVNSCPVACVDLIKTTAKPQPTAKTTASSKEYVVTLGGGSTDKIGSWQDIPTAQATIDSTKYSTISEVEFEAIMHIPNGAGEVKARLVEVTTPYVYDGNQLSTTSGTGALISTQISLQPGKKVYKVQLFTTISTGVLDEARIRIVSK